MSTTKIYSMILSTIMSAVGVVEFPQREFYLHVLKPALIITVILLNHVDQD